ncbi:hypothetical protein DL93DRAFT_2093319 [Clavulina sp. PMI_390]|nr:hypothetical protein DL93DRAFT_2093319 [Clavulina sp. PMI_390]
MTDIYPARPLSSSAPFSRLPFASSSAGVTATATAAAAAYPYTPVAAQQQQSQHFAPHHHHQQPHHLSSSSTTPSSAIPPSGYYTAASAAHDLPPLPDSHSPPSHDQHSPDMDNGLDKHDPSRPQSATFLTKLYTLLEKPEYQHMIRWDPKGEQIIVERPEQLALHVLPSIYRQSRFASFSRQLNIYGFMRKVNLRNVDPAIDDPDASTWSHPSLNRHSPPEMVANFKRRVPPRPPKSKRRSEEQQQQQQQQQLASSSSKLMGANKLPSLSSGMPSSSSGGLSMDGSTHYGSLQPVIPPGGGGDKWSHSYSRNALPPLSIPGSSNDLSQSQSAYSAGPSATSRYGGIHPITPTDDPAAAAGIVYGGGGASAGPDGYPPHHAALAAMGVSTSTPFTTTSTGWTPVSATGPGGGGFDPSPTPPGSAHGHHAHAFGHGHAHGHHHHSQLPPLNTGASSSGSLSNLLNHGNGARSPPQHHLASTYPSQYGSTLGQSVSRGPASPSATAASLSRPTTGYSISSSAHPNNSAYSQQQSPIDFQHPASAYGTFISRSRPTSSSGPPISAVGGGPGVIRRMPSTREHSMMSSMPYPAPYQRHHNSTTGAANTTATAGAGNGFGDDGSADYAAASRPMTAPSQQANPVGQRMRSFTTNASFSNTPGMGGMSSPSAGGVPNIGSSMRASAGYAYPGASTAATQGGFQSPSSYPSATSSSQAQGGGQQHLTLLTSGFPTPPSSSSASNVNSAYDHHHQASTPTPATAAQHQYSHHSHNNHQQPHPPSSSSGYPSHHNHNQNNHSSQHHTAAHTPISPTATFAYTVSGLGPPPGTAGGGAGTGTAPSTSAGGGGGEFAYTVPMPGSSHGYHHQVPPTTGGAGGSRPGTGVSVGGAATGFDFATGGDSSDGLTPNGNGATGMDTGLVGGDDYTGLVHQNGADHQQDYLGASMHNHGERPTSSSSHSQ